MDLGSISRWILKTLRRAILIILVTVSIGSSAISIQSSLAQTRMFTRPVEFNFLDWTLAAVFSKLEQWSLGTTNYIVEPTRSEIVERYLRKLDHTLRLQQKLEELYGSPQHTELEEELTAVSSELDEMRVVVGRLRPVVETLLQEDIGIELGDMGFDLAGAPFPPVLMQFSPLPSALIVSPRDEIRQEANITLQVGLMIEDKIQLEQRVESAMNVSALVVPIGGMGTYPTMIQQSPVLSWIVEVIGHEWTHNFLSLHPLGLNYDTTPELRTMNETAASLMGVELSRRVLRRSYPRYLPAEAPEQPAEASPQEEVEEAFDFRAEMHKTRVHVDDLLAEGQIEAAEEYMETRRILFWEQGYRIRRLNQAYFAFHGAYADEPGGAAGDDPVGAGVRTLWEQVNSPAEFLRLMAGLNSYGSLEELLQSTTTR